MLNTSSELSDALNPNYVGKSQGSSRPEAQQQRPVMDVPYCAPGSSALADAINPAVAPSPDTQCPAPPSRLIHSQSQDPVQLLKGLIQSIASYKTAVEQEKQRRLSWERRQESKYVARQAELEHHIAEMQEEIDMLRFALEAAQATQASQPIPPASSHELASGNATPSPNFVQQLQSGIPQDDERRSMAGSANIGSPPLLRKRAFLDTTSPQEREPMKLRACRDSRPQTVQAAMRCHILRCMEIDHDKSLPPSHIETFAHTPTTPVRFVWENTTKRSPHNAKMKKHIVSDMIECKELYPLIPVQEFTRPNLESVFEQAFMTLRQKYASQRGSEEIVLKARERTNIKTRKARRLSRKKIKLTNRINARKGHGECTLKMFDAAFQLECMSSEESSENEYEDGNSTEEELRRSAPKLGSLHIRCLQWRSARLNKLFRLVDALEEQKRSAKPKRGIGRKDRKIGPPKGGNPMPPEGVSKWMISKRWLERAHKANLNVGKILSGIITIDVDGYSDEVLAMLGDESEPDQEEQTGPQHIQEQSQAQGRRQLADQTQECYAHLGPGSPTPSISKPTLPSSRVAMDEIMQQYYHTMGFTWPSDSATYASEYYGLQQYSQTIATIMAPFTPQDSHDLT